MQRKERPSGCCDPSLEDLPLEVLLLILHALDDAQDLARLSAVCKTLFGIIEQNPDHFVWRQYWRKMMWQPGMFFVPIVVKEENCESVTLPGLCPAQHSQGKPLESATKIVDDEFTENYLTWKDCILSHLRMPQEVDDIILRIKTEGKSFVPSRSLLYKLCSTVN
jgi:hypothetical protein